MFAKLKVEEAENILEIFNECGVIGINGYIEDENEFKELQKQYNEGMDLEAEKLEEIHEKLNTEDTVDLKEIYIVLINCITTCQSFDTYRFVITN